ncbi:MAG: DUF58 domain-containing protein [Bryobacteraceae bacterium]
MNALTPLEIDAPAHPHGRLPFGFGSRFFLVLFFGLIWIVPAWWFPRFIAVMFLWDALACVVWLTDLSRLPAAAQLRARRVWSEPLSLGRQSSVRIELENSGRVPIRASLADETPLALREQPPSLEIDVPAGAGGQQPYPVLPRTRGNTAAGRVFLRYRTLLGFAERWAVAELSQTVRVLPDLIGAQSQALYLIRSSQVDMEKRHRRQRGIGREFEALREYRQGDDTRDIYWPATARRHQLTTRTYQVERSQPVWIVLDAGRLLRARVRDEDRKLSFAKLDYAVDAALALAQIAAQSGDRVGLLVYGRSIQQSIGPGRGAHHMRSLVDALAQVRGEAAEADHAKAATTLLRMQSRRALIVWITDFAETATTPEVIGHALRMTRRHLVLFTALTQPDLIALTKAIPKTEEEMFRHTAALEIAQRRERLLRGLRERGVLAIDLVPGTLTDSLINQYLEIKDRSLL